MSSLTPKQQRIAKERLVYGSGDSLFGHIEKLQGTRPFGSFLDAGTGLHSLRWIATLGGEYDEDGEKNMTDFTAVTADETMRRNVQREADELGISHLGRVVIGNWFPPDNDDRQSLLSIDNEIDSGETAAAAEGRATKLYDTILADYLIGAMAGFPPGHFSQDQMIEKLARRLKPGGRLYIVGLQPIPDVYDAKNPGAPQNIICKVRQVRDACILLAGDRCYREYPKDWIERQVDRLAAGTAAPRLKHIDSKEFPILYRHTTIVKQINVARHKLPRFPSRALANEMKKTLDDLEQQSYAATEKIQRGRRIELGFDYVVTAERVDFEDESSEN
ncbi:unnamed protein product [Pseudo-nitzschia multistriata]|uniref:Methyltransferase type 11 domain-containing protein n=1 Tax=Pseudo-nitzschia multistriata TaxID=183589 RepID=A0A448ZDW4_9STRA|nr:unnamed protein product [Pseudo-nitzschia multistriata]